MARRRIVVVVLMGLAVSLAAGFTAPTASHAAAPVVWSGQGQSENAPWSDTGNWVGGVAPVNGDTLSFPSSASSLLSTDDLSGLTVAGITFDGAYQVYGVDLTVTGPIDFGSGAGQVVIGNNLVLDTATVAITNNDSAAQLFSGDISETGGSRALHAFGPGPIDLDGNNTYTGLTTVDGPSAAQVFIDGNSPSSDVTIGSGGTLGGGGTTGDVTDATGGTVAPGHSPGHLTLGALTLNSASTLAAEIDGTAAGSQYDQITSTGAVSLGNATLSLVLGFTPAAGNAFTLIDNAGPGAVTGRFLGHQEGDEFTSGGQFFRITYAGNSGNDVVLTALTSFTSATTVASSLNPASDTETVTFQAHVSAIAGTPSGTVSFLDGSTVLGTVNLSAGNDAALTTSSLTDGSHAITARYNGDPNFGGSTAGLTQVVNGTSAPTPSAGAPIPTGGYALLGTGLLLTILGVGPLSSRPRRTRVVAGR